MLERLGEGIRDRLRDWTQRKMDESKMAALARPKNEFGVDPFGFDADYALATAAPFLWLYKHYFRVETHGIENVPEGRVLLVSNHSGQIPIDGAMIGVAMLTEASPPRAMRALVE
jgi:1-acyl-sn-glycerol-3-phosphate acyltransferase